MENKKTWLYVILLIPLILVLYGISGVKADSGFDVGYDGGGYSGGGWSSSNSSWSSGNSWSSSSDRHYGSYRGSSSSSSYRGSSKSDPFDLPSPHFYFDGARDIAIILGLIIAIIMALSLKYDDTDVKAKSKLYKGYPRNYVSEEEVRKYIPNFKLDKFAKERFKDYVDIQNAWMNFDYDVLRSKLTDELFNQYRMQLDTLKIKNQKNVMKDFEMSNANVISIKKENEEVEIRLEMTISFYDYIESNGKIERGSALIKVNVCYDLVFICNVGPNLNKCPNCHADLSNNSSQVCEYCRTVISRTGKNWVMSRKINKRQW